MRSDRSHFGRRNDLSLRTHGRLGGRRPFGPIRRRLTLQGRKLDDSAKVEAKLRRAEAALAAARDRVAGWTMKPNRFATLGDGLRKTYERGRERMADAEADSSSRRMHEWRKRAKHHWLHARRLAPIWSGPMRAHASAAHSLSATLGDYHDLAEFDLRLRADPDAFGEAADRDAFLALLAARRTALADRAFRLGARLYAEPASALSKRWKRYWKAWCAEPQRIAA